MCFFVSISHILTYFCVFIFTFRFDANKSTKGASKLRRDLINSEIANLRDLLPLPQSTRQRLSQLQLMALICVYVRKANYFQQGKFTFFYFTQYSYKWQRHRNLIISKNRIVHVNVIVKSVYFIINYKQNAANFLFCVTILNKFIK